MALQRNCLCLFIELKTSDGSGGTSSRSISLACKGSHHHRGKMERERAKTKFLLTQHSERRRESYVFSFIFGSPNYISAQRQRQLLTRSKRKRKLPARTRELLNSASWSWGSLRGWAFFSCISLPHLQKDTSWWDRIWLAHYHICTGASDIGKHFRFRAFFITVWWVCRHLVTVPLPSPQFCSCDSRRFYFSSLLTIWWMLPSTLCHRDKAIAINSTTLLGSENNNNRREEQNCFALNWRPLSRLAGSSSAHHHFP